MNESELLKQYLPQGAVEDVYRWIVEKKIHLKITKSRRTKLGDYRPPIHQPNHRISLNHNLNPFSFLITFVHELAHLLVFEQFGNKVAPHGKEWKTTYQKLMLPFLEKDIFPVDLKHVLSKSINNSRASSTSDLHLSRVLLSYDTPNDHKRLEQLESESIFQIENGKTFKKGDRQRTRYKCLNLQNKRYYLFHPLTPVYPIKDGF